ncbi:MAG: hypothetical protein HYV36_07355 [Lentisphaerae bacterium]|nr:hypothetical protein [Lentisphaerota bacterium]
MRSVGCVRARRALPLFLWVVLVLLNAVAVGEDRIAFVSYPESTPSGPRGHERVWGSVDGYDAKTTAISPSVKVNASSGPSSNQYGETITVTLQLDAGGVQSDMDWWLAAEYSGTWYHYVNYQWSAIGNLSGIQPAYQGPLVNLSSTEVVNSAALSPGGYTVYFGVDPLNGQLDDSIVYATATFIIAPPSVGITDPSLVLAQPSMALQPVGASFTEPVFGATLRRVVDAPNQNGSHHERHEYSQLQAFNRDSSLIWQNQNGSFVVRDVKTGALVFTLPDDINAPRWNPANGDEIIFFDSNDTGSGNVTVVVEKVNVRTGSRSALMTLPGTYERVSAAISWEEMSRDGRWLGAYLYQADGNMRFVAIDVRNRTLGAQLSVSGDGGPNWVAASPSGQYLVIQWNGDGAERYRGVELYNITTGAYVGHVAEHRQHGDMGYDENGNEIYVTTYFGNSLLLTTTRFPGSVNFSAGYDKVILDTGWDHVGHISCQGPNGVCVLSGDGNAGQPFAGEIYLVYTAGTAADNGQNSQALVRRLAHHRSSNCEYYHQPQPTMSLDGRYVIFASDWGVCDNGADDYIIDLWSMNE